LGPFFSREYILTSSYLLSLSLLLSLAFARFLLHGHSARVGITGQDGSYLTELLLAKGYTVHGIIRRSSSFNTGRIEHLYRDQHERPNMVRSERAVEPRNEAELTAREWI